MADPPRARGGAEWGARPAAGDARGIRAARAPQAVPPIHRPRIARPVARPATGPPMISTKITTRKRHEDRARYLEGPREESTL